MVIKNVLLHTVWLAMVPSVNSSLLAVASETVKKTEKQSRSANQVPAVLNSKVRLGNWLPAW